MTRPSPRTTALAAFVVTGFVMFSAGVGVCALWEVVAGA